MPPLTALSGALLGLINESPRSGYDLRKVFATTPMRHFSDSPGAIYPALRRLRAEGLVTARVAGRSLRPREIYQLTPKGRTALRAWASAPPTRADVVDGVGPLVLRFVLAFSSAGSKAAEAFLGALERELTTYTAELEAFYQAERENMHLGARLGLERGIEMYAADLQWCRRARQTLRREGGK